MELPLPVGQTRPERSWIVIVLHTITILSAFGALCVALIVPRFRAIFADILGERPLPQITNAVLQFYPVLISFAFIIVLGAVYSAWRGGRTRAPSSIVWALTFVAGLQTSVTVYALFLPLIGLVQSHAIAL